MANINFPSTVGMPIGTKYEDPVSGNTYIWTGVLWRAQTVSDILADKANDNAVVHLTGNETIDGTKTFQASPQLPDVGSDDTNDSNNAASTKFVQNVIRNKPLYIVGQFNGVSEIDGVSTFEFLNIPAWARRLTFVMGAVGFDPTGATTKWKNILIKLGVASGYVSDPNSIYGETQIFGDVSGELKWHLDGGADGGRDLYNVIIYRTQTGNKAIHATVEFTKIGNSNLWNISLIGFEGHDNYRFDGAGICSLPSALTKLKLYTSALDGGSIATVGFADSGITLYAE